MKPEGSLPCSQAPATELYPEPVHALTPYFVLITHIYSHMFMSQHNTDIIMLSPTRNY
jgi:hypothetical protein